jgi:hypothetical protein
VRLVGVKEDDGGTGDIEDDVVRSVPIRLLLGRLRLVEDGALPRLDSPPPSSPPHP